MDAFRLTRRPGVVPITFRSEPLLRGPSPRNQLKVIAELSDEHSTFVNDALGASSALSGGQLRVLICIEPEKARPRLVQRHGPD